MHTRILCLAVKFPPYSSYLLFFDSAQSQKSKSEVCAHEFYVAMHIRTPFDNTLYLSSLLSHQPVSYFLVVTAVFFF